MLSFPHAQMLRKRVVCRCVSGFYLAKSYAADNDGRTVRASVLSFAHDLGEIEGRVECVLTEGDLHGYSFNWTCIVCPAGKVRAAAGMSSLSPQDIVRNEHSVVSSFEI
jgi:hypothetical protein